MTIHNTDLVYPTVRSASINHYIIINYHTYRCVYQVCSTININSLHHKLYRVGAKNAKTRKEFKVKLIYIYVYKVIYNLMYFVF